MAITLYALTLGPKRLTRICNSVEEANERKDALVRAGIPAHHITITKYHPQVSDDITPIVHIGNRDARYDGWQSTRNTSRYGKEV